MTGKKPADSETAILREALRRLALVDPEPPVTLERAKRLGEALAAPAPQELPQAWLRRMQAAGAEAGARFTPLAAIERLAAADDTGAEIPLPPLGQALETEDGRFRLTVTLEDGWIRLQIETLGFATDAFADRRLGIAGADGAHEWLAIIQLNEDGEGSERVPDEPAVRRALLQPVIGLIEEIQPTPHPQVREDDKRRSVFIPIVQPGVEALAGQRLHTPDIPRLIEVYSRPYSASDKEHQRLDRQALNKDWDWVAAPLRRVGLYQAGCVAASAVRRLGFERPRAAFYRRFRPQAWIEKQRLHSFSPVGPTEGRSAELGLALALLMNAASTAHRYAFATGALSRDPGRRHNDVEVLPVGSLPEKLALVIQYLREKGLPGGGKRKLLFFTPAVFDKNGVSTAVTALAEVQALSRLGVEVVPVAWLSEAAQALHAQRAPYTGRGRLLQVIAGVCAIGALAGALWYFAIASDSRLKDDRPAVAASPPVNNDLSLWQAWHALMIAEVELGPEKHPEITTCLTQLAQWFEAGHPLEAERLRERALILKQKALESQTITDSGVLQCHFLHSL